MSSLLISPPSLAAADPTVLGAGEVLGLLIVSSNEELRRELLVRLQSDHWTLDQVASGAEALEKIDAGAVSMVLMDPNLPDLEVDEFRAIVQAQED
jgi:DNA-binding response OmpR family regulator